MTTVFVLIFTFSVHGNIPPPCLGYFFLAACQLVHVSEAGEKVFPRKDSRFVFLTRRDRTLKCDRIENFSNGVNIVGRLKYYISGLYNVTKALIFICRFKEIVNVFRRIRRLMKLLLIVRK